MASREELQERLSKALAAKAKEEASSQDELDLLELEAQVEAEELLASEKAAVNEAIIKEGGPAKVRVVETPHGHVVLKRPNAVLYRRFLDGGEKSMKSQELEKLIRKCVVFPDQNKLDKIFNEEPASLVRCGDVVVELAGFRRSEIEGK